MGKEMNFNFVLHFFVLFSDESNNNHNENLLFFKKKENEKCMYSKITKPVD